VANSSGGVRSKLQRQFSSQTPWSCPNGSRGAAPSGGARGGGRGTRGSCGVPDDRVLRRGRDRQRGRVPPGVRPGVGGARHTPGIGDLPGADRRPQNQGEAVRSRRTGTEVRLNPRPATGAVADCGNCVGDSIERTPSGRIPQRPQVRNIPTTKRNPDPPGRSFDPRVEGSSPSRPTTQATAALQVRILSPLHSRRRPDPCILLRCLSLARALQ